MNYAARGLDAPKGIHASPPPSAPPRLQVGLRAKLYYGIGSVAYAVKDNGFNVFLMIFYNQVIGLPASWVGAAAMVALFLDAFIDPVIGYVSDNWRSRWGRRHPFMYVAALPAGISYLLLWNPPDGWSHAALFGYLVISIIIVRTFLALYEIPSAALVPELTKDYDERTSFFSIRFLIGTVSAVAISAMAYSVFLQPDATSDVGQLNRAGYGHYGLFTGVLMAAAILISAAGTHRYIPLLTQPPKRQRIPVRQRWREAVETLSNPFFIMLVVGGTFGSMASGLATSLTIYYNTFFWELTSDEITLLVLTSFVGVAGGSLSAPYFSRRWGKKHTFIALLLVVLVTGSAMPLLRIADLLPGNESPVILPLLAVSQFLILFFGIAASVARTAMMSDVVEDNELRTGRRTEGLFVAANSFVQKCVSGAGLLATGILLATIGFPEGAKPGSVDAAVLRNLALSDVFVTGSLYVLSIVCILPYRIDRDRHEENLRKLASRRALEDEHV